MREFEVSESLLKKLSKLSRKDRKKYDLILKKIEEICSGDIGHYKNLRYGLKEFKRVHIGHHVLVFKYDRDIVIFTDFDHHDNIYSKN